MVINQFKDILNSNYMRLNGCNKIIKMCFIFLLEKVNKSYLFD